MLIQVIAVFITIFISVLFVIAISHVMSRRQEETRRERLLEHKYWWITNMQPLIQEREMRHQKHLNRMAELKQSETSE